MKKDEPILIFVPPILLAISLSTIFLCHLSLFSFSRIGFIVAAAVSIYVYARYAFEIHDMEKRKVSEIVNNSDWFVYNQYWFNGLGVFIGWLALYILLFHRLGIDYSHYHFQYLQWQDFVLALVAFFGITGHFPLASLLGRLSGK